MKIYELARELGLSTKNTMATIGDLGLITPTNHFQALSEEQANIVRRHVLRSAMSDSSLDQEEPSLPPPACPKPQLIVRRRSGTQRRVIKKEQNLRATVPGLDH